MTQRRQAGEIEVTCITEAWSEPRAMVIQGTEIPDLLDVQIAKFLFSKIKE